MQPGNLNVRLREDLGRRGLQQAEVGGDMTRTPEVRRLRSDGTESWIEVSSRPSSSSLSSAATDDIITTGLRVQHPHARRRHRLGRNEVQAHGALTRAASAAGSSQEEYEESESESDRILNSSNEGIEPRSSQENSPPEPISSASDTVPSDVGEDDDEDSTALGVNNKEPCFTPQPNAFSHPPQPNATRRSLPSETRGSYFPNARETASRPAARSVPDERPRSHTPYNIISPSHQADHDAALRASLSTLLSCAAAARGLPKREQVVQNTRRQSSRPEPLSIRMVPESAIMGHDATGYEVAARRNSSTSSVQASYGKGKRKASTSKDRREARSKRHASTTEMTVAPTLMTWVVSAGVVVLFSAISFSAGYTIGREVGRMEVGMSPRQGGMGNKEMGRGLRRLRWGSASTVVRV